MEYEERKKLCGRIVSGITIVTFNGNTYYINDPVPETFYRASQIYESTLELLSDSGVPTESEIRLLLLERKVFGPAEEVQIKDLELNLKKLKGRLPELEFRSIEKKEVEVYIEKTKELISSLEKRRFYLLSYSAENIANMEMYKSILRQNTRLESGKLLWATPIEFAQTPNRLIEHLLMLSYFNGDVTESTIRELARTEPWRSMWVAAQKVGNLFERPITAWTDLQKALASWSIVYDSVYESMESPSQDIINNDQLLDNWLEEQSDKRKAKTSGGDGRSISSNPAINNGQEVGVVVNSEEDARRVYKLNDGSSLGTIRSREQVIKNNQLVKEIDLPDVRQRVQLELNQLAASRAKGN